MHNILLLTDFSAASQHAVAFAQALFADTATNFCLVNTFELQPEVSYGGANVLAEERAAAEQRLHDFRLLMTQQPVPTYHTYRTLVVLGDLESAVDKLLTHERFDLVVVGATGAGFSEFFGSFATGLIRSATTNVLVVPASAPIKPLERVVLATDFRSVKNTGSFALLKDLALRKSAQLTLLTIENPLHADAQASASNQRQQYIDQIFEDVQTEMYSIHDESVLNGINAYLDNHTVDMLVLLPRRKSFVNVLRGNSITRSIAYRARVPLLTLYDAKTGEPTNPMPSQDLGVIPHI